MAPRPENKQSKRATGCKRRKQVKITEKLLHSLAAAGRVEYSKQRSNRRERRIHEAGHTDEDHRESLLASADEREADAAEARAKKEKEVHEKMDEVLVSVDSTHEQAYEAHVRGEKKVIAYDPVILERAAESFSRWTGEVSGGLLCVIHLTFSSIGAALGKSSASFFDNFTAVPQQTLSDAIAYHSKTGVGEATA